jgi:hypothetical protein
LRYLHKKNIVIRNFSAQTVALGEPGNESDLKIVDLFFAASLKQIK